MEPRKINIKTTKKLSNNTKNYIFKHNDEIYLSSLKCSRIGGIKMVTITEEDKKLINQYQSYQQQFQAILIQKESIRAQQLETETALEDLETCKDEYAYKISGPIMIKKTVADIKKELEEKKENFDLRIKTLEKAEARVKEKLNETEPKLKKILGG